MSGSDGNSNAGSAFDGGGPSDDCSTVVLDTVLNPADPAEPFAVGNEYDVLLQASGPTETIVIINAAGSPVGAIAPVPPLLRCLRNGVPFYAEVLGVNAGEVKVRVKSRL